jgi:cysteine synthase
MNFPTIESFVGNTPLVRLQRLPGETSNTILVKLEGNNPAGSVKDRPALSMIQHAEARGDIKPGDCLIEATSGNTGIALAMAAAIKGYKMILIMPNNMSAERIASMKAYGAEIILTPAAGSMEGAIDLARAMQAEGKGLILDQFANSDNPLAHYESTGPEIWRDTGGRITHFVSSMGTTGTIMGTSRFLKEHRVSTALKRVTTKVAAEKSATLVLDSTSPTLRKILDWTLVWSDNLLAERIARLAAQAAGHTLDDAGVAKTFNELLTSLGINTSHLVVKDASGLSKENRITARQISQLLMVIYHNPKYAPIVSGLPIGGVSGTLQNRFVETAPEAVGLVKAKTGTLNGTTNLAGFVESGDHQYIFVVIADRHSKSYTVTKKVRATVDRILGKIATPLLPELLPLAPSSESATVTN